jgi:alpha-beta hydrolase superfamily lysophospholipase
MAGYRIAIRQAFAGPQVRQIDDVRWALQSLEPGGRRMRYGAFVASDGAEVPFRLWQPGRPRAALVLLHGCCDYSGAFDAVGPRLARSGFAVMAYDQRGFGASPSRGVWAGEARLVGDVRDAADFLRSRLPGPVPLFVIGESMGGAVAVHAAAEEAVPGLAGIVLVAPGALASALRRSFYGWLIYLFRLILGDAELVVERLDHSELSAAAAIRMFGDPLVMRSINASLLDGVVTLAASAVEAAGRVRIPVLTLVGAKDELLRRECIHELHENLAGPKSWAEIEDGPHLLLHWNRGREVLRTVRRWIERHR